MKQLKVSDFIIRLVLVGFWIGLLVGLLFVSNIQFFAQPNSITVLSWWGTFERGYIKKFEKETGIKVHLSYYATNEELLVKLRATQGKGYDLVIPSDYAVKKISDENLLKKIDKSQLDFYSQLNPLILGQSFDPHNDYSIPYEWEVYMVGINKKIFTSELPNADTAWDFIFKPQNFGKDYRIVMPSDPVEAILFTANYLFGPVKKLTHDQVNVVKDLLINQKKFVEAYANVRSDYFLGTGNAFAILGQNAEVWRAVRDYDYVDFIIPKNTFISIENCAIPVESAKESLVYEFLNFFYTKDAYQHHYKDQLFCPARLDVIDELDASERQKKIMRSSPEAFSHYSFIRDILPEQQKHNLWIAVKS